MGLNPPAAKIDRRRYQLGYAGLGSGCGANSNAAGYLWGELAIRLSPLDAPAAAAGNRRHSLRLAVWGRFLGAPSGSGGLAIRHPPLHAPAAAAENRRHSLRLAAMPSL